MNRSFEQTLFGEETLTLRNVVFCVAAWEVLYQLTKALFSWSVHTYPSMIWEKGNKTKFLEAGPSYFVGAINAALVAFRCTYVASRLKDASLEEQVLCTGGGYDDEAFFSRTTNLIVLSYFLYDIAHCLAMYPKLGGMDVLGHHIGHILLAYLAGTRKFLYYTGNYIAIIEWSTPFLSTRFLLIQAGRGHTRMMTLTNLAFALTFLSLRAIFLSYGMIELTTIIGQVMDLVTPSHISIITFCFMMAMIYLAWFLQLFWAYKIVGMVIKATKRNQKEETTNIESVQEKRGGDVDSERKKK